LVGVDPRLGGASDDARAPERRFTSFAPCVREEEGGQCRARTSRFEEGDEDFGDVGRGAGRRGAKGDAGPAHT